LYSKESREINVGHFRHVSLQLIIVFRVADDLDWDSGFRLAAHSELNAAIWFPVSSESK